jgi:hypothetical protein
MMSVAGPLFAVGGACFFSGLYRVCTGARRRIRGDWALMALGAGMIGAAYELLSRGAA